MRLRHMTWLVLMIVGLIVAVALKNMLESDIPIYAYAVFGILLTLIIGSRDWK